MIYRNLTPHKVVVENENIRIVFERDSSEPVARLNNCTEETNLTHVIAPGVRITLPLQIITQDKITGLPEPEEGTVFITSSMVAMTAKRVDVISPISDATASRDASGRVLSVRGFQSYVEAKPKQDVVAEADKALVTV